MRSPSSSSDLFFPSPPQSLVPNLEQKVQSLYQTARGVGSLDSRLSDLIDQNHQTFFIIFGRQLRYLTSRSQHFKDGQLTVYDKVLLLLTENGCSLENPAAINWYCTKYLGFGNDENDSSNVVAAKESLDTIFAISRVVTPPVNSPAHVSTPAKHDDDKPNASTETDPDPASKRDPRFLKFWAVYSKARTDYLAVADKHDASTLDTAKFLRDTAENGIHFLENKKPTDEAVLEELKNTYNTAKEVVVQLNGGKKRKFDRATDRAGGRGRPRLPPLPPHTTAHDRLNATRRREQRKISGERRQRARGPSGIPYGYTRPVDSYYPR